MKPFAPIPLTVNSPRAIGQPRAVRYRLSSKRSLRRRFRHFIESTDWEERYLCNHWIDRICMGGIVASIIYFIANGLNVLL
jgi:hypothetical protein